MCHDGIDLDEIRDFKSGFIIRRGGRLQLRMPRGAKPENHYYYGSRDTGYDGVAPRIEKAKRRLKEYEEDPKKPYPMVTAADAISAYNHGEKLSQDLDRLERVEETKSRIILGLLRKLGTSVVYEPDFTYVNDCVLTCLICGSNRENDKEPMMIDHIEGQCIFNEGPSFDFRFE